MSATEAIVTFVLGSTLSLSTSWLLVTRLERLGERFGFSEALLGLLAALAADTPEVTSAITALSRHQSAVGAGVVLGSNVFNLAALLGLGAIVAGTILLHRKVILFTGIVGLAVAADGLAAMTGALSPAVALAVVAVVLAPYGALCGLSRYRLSRLPLPGRARSWLSEAIREEEAELEEVFHPARGHLRDAGITLVALAVVVGASIAMERAATSIGTREHISGIVVGGVVLAVVTSLPNAVAAIYLARRNRGAAVFSTALNSNAFNIAFGLLLPGALVGIGRLSSRSLVVAVWYLGLTLIAIAFAYREHALRRPVGIAIVSAYSAFALSLVVPAGWPFTLTVIATSVGLFGLFAGLWFLRPRRGAVPLSEPG